MANWHDMLNERMTELGDNFTERVCTLSDEDMKVEFDDGYGGVEGKAFTAWGQNYVYFPICYDGSEWIGYAPRNPCDMTMEHQGGG